MKATYKGKVADQVAATATLIKSALDPTENDKGPYFKDADGKTVRTLTGLETDKDGLLKLPKLYADDTAGDVHAPHHHPGRRGDQRPAHRRGGRDVLTEPVPVRKRFGQRIGQSQRVASTTLTAAPLFGRAPPLCARCSHLTRPLLRCRT